MGCWCERDNCVANTHTSAQADMSDIARENAMSPRGGYTESLVAYHRTMTAAELEVTVGMDLAFIEGFERATQIERERCLRLVWIYRNHAARGSMTRLDMESLHAHIAMQTPDEFAPAVPATTDTTAERE